LRVTLNDWSDLPECHRDEDVSHISIDELDELDELDMDVQAIQFFIKQPNDL
jgi:hypothetical protein